MKTIPDRTDLHERENVLLYNQLLDRYNTIDEQRKQQPVRVSMINPPGEAPTVLPPTTVDPSPAVSGLLESDIVESAPKTMKQRVRLLLEKLKADPTTPWKERGEFVYNGVPIRGSNMVDLVNDVLRKRKASSPVGWESFARHLRHMNTPMEFIGNPDRRDYMLARTNADVANLKKYNDGTKFLLTVIDVFSKRTWCVPLKNKVGATLVAAFESLLTENTTPTALQTDKGAEFLKSF